MNPVPFVDIHTHTSREEKETVTVQNIFPGEDFATFHGRNFYSVGLHPWYIRSEAENNEALQLMEDALEYDHVIFVGEAGLDKITKTDFTEQQRVFKAQAFMAEEYQYPLVIHCVKAYNEVIELRKKMQPSMPWIVHAYNGSIEQTKQMLDMGFLFSFGDILMHDRSKAIESFRFLPVDKLFFETDEADVNVEAFYSKGAELKQISLEELKYSVWKNFNRIEKTLSRRS